MNFGANVKKERMRQGITQTELAERVGLSAGAIAQYEIAVKSPSIITAERIAEALGVKLADLLEGE